jgi:hypothetical protein
VYVYYSKKLNMGINEKVYDKIPDDVANEVKQYMK